MARPLRILVAEDDENDVLLMQRAFAKAEMQAPVHFVRDGQEVIDYLERKPPFEDPAAHPQPTLLLLDLKMPRLDGFDVLKWLRRQPSLGQQLLVVVFTSSDEPRDRHRAYVLGADSYAVKPHDAQEFIDVVQEMEKHWLRLNATPECGFEGD